MSQERTLNVPEDDWALIDVVVVMLSPEEGEATLMVRVVDPDGAPVDGVEVWLDDAPLGRTSTGGTVRLNQLAPGLRNLRVAREQMRPLDPMTVQLAAGSQERVVQMRWLPGQVEVRTRSPEGPVVDATVRFFGPQPVSPRALGADGEARLTLEPGEWTALVTSETWGAQQRYSVLNLTPTCWSGWSSTFSARRVDSRS